MFESFFNGFVAFAANNKVSLIFYGALILLIILFRKKLEWQGIAGLYKTKVGVSLMQRLADKHGPFFRWLGYCGIGVGFAGMLFIVVTLINGLWKLIFEPTAPAVVAPVIPGFNIPGVDIHVPLIIGWLALFLVIAVHEFSHGVVSKAHKIPVHSSGLLVFGPILGAFVEPDEKKMAKSSDVIQYSITAAGPFSNIIAAGFAFVLSILIAFAVAAMTIPAGISLNTVTPDMPADLAGLEAGVVIVEAQGVPITTQEDFLSALSTVREGDTVSLKSAEQEYVLTAASDADERTQKGLIGVTLKSEQAPKYLGWGIHALSALLLIQEFVMWLFILNLGIGLANLLPLGPVDGGRMVQTLFRSFWGEEKGDARWKLVSKVTLAVLLVLLFVPMFI